jgi:hypothetical protein
MDIKRKAVLEGGAALALAAGGAGVANAVVRLAPDFQKIAIDADPEEPDAGKSPGA